MDQEASKVPLGGDTLSGARAMGLVIRCVHGLSEEDKGGATHLPKEEQTPASF